MQDPRELGADCDNCPLRCMTRPPVFAERPPGRPLYAVVGEAPGPVETVTGRPFDGPSGKLLDEYLAAAGLLRHEAVITNAVLCMPEGVSFEAFEMKFNLDNNERKRLNDPAYPPRRHPIACCAPRLEADLQGIENIITVGARGLNAMLPGIRRKLDDLAGSPMTLRRPSADGKWVIQPNENIPEEMLRWPHRKLLATVHPARILPGREPKWRFAFLADLAKARRFFSNRLEWVDAPFSTNPTVQSFARFLGVVRTQAGWVAHPGMSRALSWDFETNSKEPLLAEIRCLGIGDEKGVVVAHFLSRDGRTRLLHPSIEAEFKDIIHAWALGPALKIGWNSSGYDTLVFMQWLGIVPQNQLDGILIDRNLHGELPHTLRHLGRMTTDIINWKAGKEAVDDGDGIKDDTTLVKYNVRDVQVTHVGTLNLARLAMQRGLLRFNANGELDPECIVGVDHDVASACRTMHINGLLVDEVERKRHYTEQMTKAVEFEAAFRKIVNDPSININSTTQMARLLFSRSGWNLPHDPECENDAGLPSVSSDSTRWLLQQSFLSDEQRAAIVAYRKAKAAKKLVSTYLVRTAPLVVDDERKTEAAESRAKADTALMAARSMMPIPDAESWDPAQKTSATRKALAATLYEHWGIPPIRTPNGTPTVSHDSLVRLWQRSNLPAHARRFLSALLSWDRHYDEWIRLSQDKPTDEEVERCILWLDGRIHAQWKPHVAITGRIASSPNLQNVPIFLRSMFIPGKGHVYVYADADQVELRIAAIRWGATRYLEAFERGMDPHQITMHMIWGDEVWTWEGAPKVPFYKSSKDAEVVGLNKQNGAWKIGGYFGRQRDLSKKVQYASQYAAELPTVFGIIVSSTNKTGDLAYLHLTMDDVAKMRDAWLTNCPEIPQGWETEKRNWKRQGFLTEPVTGRTFYFLDGEDLNKLANLCVQGSAAGLVNRATREICAKYPLQYAGEHTGLVIQVHDMLTLEVPEADGPMVARDLKAAMGRGHPSYAIKFGAEAYVKKNLAE